MKKILLLMMSATLLFSCKKDKEKEKDYKSAEVQLHDGKVWSNLHVDKDGVPQQFSIVMTNSVLSSVPVGGEGEDHEDLFVPVHSKVSGLTPFKSIMLNWNRNGHEPAGVYTVPHFDLHFYMTSEDEIMGYTDMTKIDQNLPAADYIPAHHVPGPGVPMMGKHWIDVTSPELNGQPFTQTFIYGSYDSKVVFYEPMITLAFLQQTTSFERPIPQPAKFGIAGYYPTKERVSKHDGVTEVILDGFVKRAAN